MLLFRYIMLLFMCSTPIMAEEKPIPGKPAFEKPTSKSEVRIQEKEKREADLRSIEGQIHQSDEQRQQVLKQVENLKGDRAKLNKDLIDTTTRIRVIDGRLNAVELKLDDLEKNAAVLKTSLEARKDVMIEVLVALQRMGRKPPPAVFVRPDDILAALRASILLGDVLPGLRRDVEILVSDLDTLNTNQKNQAAERENLAKEKQNASSERERLTILVSSRQSQIEISEQKLRDERARITSLAKEVLTLKDLIMRMETDITGAAKAAEAARLVPLPGNGVARDDAFKDAARLAPKIAFAELRGSLALPAAGDVVKTYGSSDGYGGTEKGITIMPPSGAILSAPSDGWVAFSGPYRSYGQVLIINTGGGYHIVFIGIDHTLVEIGQFVLAGEPIAVMSRKQQTSSKSDLSEKASALYIELRKDGQAIDSRPWWGQLQNEKARG